jgi:hypothetical protein
LPSTAVPLSQSSSTTGHFHLLTLTSTDCRHLLLLLHPYRFPSLFPWTLVPHVMTELCPSKITYWSPDPQVPKIRTLFGDSLEKQWRLNKVTHIGCYSHRTGVLIRRGRNFRVAGTKRKSLWGCSKDSLCKLQKQSSSETDPHLDLGLLASRTAGKSICISLSCPVCGIS